MAKCRQRQRHPFGGYVHDDAEVRQSGWRQRLLIMVLKQPPTQTYAAPASFTRSLTRPAHTLPPMLCSPGVADKGDKNWL